MHDDFLNDFIKREMDATIEKNNKKIEEIMNEKGIKNLDCIDCLVKDEFGNVVDVIPKTKKKKLFISLPMAGKSEEEIRNKMAEYKENAEYLMGEELELIDSFMEVDAPEDIKDAGVWYLGKSIMMMAEADVVYFGRGWRSARGCVVEYEAAYRYKILRIEDAPYWDRQF